jgi:bifunctional DNase/RNase
MELIPITFRKLLQSNAYTAIILGTPQKQFAIYTEPSVGKTLQSYLIQEPKQRPYTFDLVNAIFKGLNVKPLQVVIHDMEDTVYFARLFLEQQIGEEKQILEIDARPSDCIALALVNNIPLFCRRTVYDKAAAAEN